MSEPTCLQNLEKAGRRELARQAEATAVELQLTIREMLGHLDQLDMALQLHATRRRRFYYLVLQSIPRIMLNTSASSRAEEPLSSQYPGTSSFVRRQQCNEAPAMEAWKRLCAERRAELPSWYAPLWWADRSVCPVYNAHRNKCAASGKAHAEHKCLLCGGAHGVSHRHPVSNVFLCPEMARMRSELKRLGWDGEDLAMLATLWNEKEQGAAASARRQIRERALLGCVLDLFLDVPGISIGQPLQFALAGLLQWPAAKRQACEQEFGSLYHFIASRCPYIEEGSALVPWVKARVAEINMCCAILHLDNTLYMDVAMGLTHELAVFAASSDFDPIKHFVQVVSAPCAIEKHRAISRSWTREEYAMQRRRLLRSHCTPHGEELVARNFLSFLFMARKGPDTPARAAESHPGDTRSPLFGEPPQPAVRSAPPSAAPLCGPQRGQPAGVGGAQRNSEAQGAAAPGEGPTSRSSPAPVSVPPQRVPTRKERRRAAAAEHAVQRRAEEAARAKISAATVAAFAAVLIALGASSTMAHKAGTQTPEGAKKARGKKRKSASVTVEGAGKDAVTESIQQTKAVGVAAASEEVTRAPPELTQNHSLPCGATTPLADRGVAAARSGEPVQHAEESRPPQSEPQLAPEKRELAADGLSLTIAQCPAATPRVFTATQVHQPSPAEDPLAEAIFDLEDDEEQERDMLMVEDSELRALFREHALRAVQELRRGQRVDAAEASVAKDDAPGDARLREVVISLRHHAPYDSEMGLSIPVSALVNLSADAEMRISASSALQWCPRDQGRGKCTKAECDKAHLTKQYKPVAEEFFEQELRLERSRIARCVRISANAKGALDPDAVLQRIERDIGCYVNYRWPSTPRQQDARVLAVQMQSKSDADELRRAKWNGYVKEPLNWALPEAELGACFQGSSPTPSAGLPTAGAHRDPLPGCRREGCTAENLSVEFPTMYQLVLRVPDPAQLRAWKDKLSKMKIKPPSDLFASLFILGPDFCIGYNRPGGKGCLFSGCERHHACVLCGSAEHGVYFRDDDECFVCEEMDALDRECKECRRRGWTDEDIRTCVQQRRHTLGGRIRQRRHLLAAGPGCWGAAGPEEAEDVAEEGSSCESSSQSEEHGAEQVSEVDWRQCVAEPSPRWASDGTRKVKMRIVHADVRAGRGRKVSAAWEDGLCGADCDWDVSYDADTTGYVSPRRRQPQEGACALVVVVGAAVAVKVHAQREQREERLSRTAIVLVAISGRVAAGVARSHLRARKSRLAAAARSALLAGAAAAAVAAAGRLRERTEASVGPSGCGKAKLYQPPRQRDPVLLTRVVQHGADFLACSLPGGRQATTCVTACRVVAGHSWWAGEWAWADEGTGRQGGSFSIAPCSMADAFGLFICGGGIGTLYCIRPHGQDGGEQLKCDRLHDLEGAKGAELLSARASCPPSRAPPQRAGDMHGGFASPMHQGTPPPPIYPPTQFSVPAAGPRYGPPLGPQYGPPPGAPFHPPPPAPPPYPAPCAALPGRYPGACPGAVLPSPTPPTRDPATGAHLPYGAPVPPPGAWAPSAARSVPPTVSYLSGQNAPMAPPTPEVPVAPLSGAVPKQGSSPGKKYRARKAKEPDRAVPKPRGPAAEEPNALRVALRHKGELCSKWQRGLCSEKNCFYAHGRDEIKQKRPCTHWAESDPPSCPFGDECWYTHGEKEQRLADEFVARGVSAGLSPSRLRDAFANSIRETQPAPTEPPARWVSDRARKAAMRIVHEDVQTGAAAHRAGGGEGAAQPDAGATGGTGRPLWRGRSA
eukprot:TRINITY_DN5630_c0_g1_i1.p1 TRINITY_DN5630_c0_g1~~TRINITY_DN5630_c0_g1_i1.p1  ORF type:complete len:1781 (+),score=177.66 TRINITY_DN5630_c0_g1_i1:98-5440(+)